MYCTLDDLKTVLDETRLADLAGDRKGASLDEAKSQAALNAAIAAACEEIDGALAGRYPVPVVPTPLRLKTLCARIAVYVLHRRKNQDAWDKDYDAARRTLERLADGRERLTPEEDVPAADTGGVAVVAPRARFGDREMERY